MKRGTLIIALLIIFIMLVLLLTSACEDIGKSCDEQGVCTGTADEDQNTLEVPLIDDIAPDNQESSNKAS